ncbi:hypothetical protein LTR62_008200 [Meristemomyces frigidus]|uniref:TLC domain-containing protein n=1 Tax=Meristemomyces frigidus TaxID=1508187 RepID=A0AAN7T9S0_9PEZI|nr:hypothetical protein LTR62_008200 [Meristemomyces frigidus]
MRDPFPIAPPPVLVRLTKPYADALGLSTLPLHIHEVLFALCLYTFVCTVVSPYLSKKFYPERYAALNHRTKVSWDVHVVSFVQSCIICSLSLYIILFDEDRKSWRGADRWQERVWGYSGATGLCQSFALGYFTWDLIMCTWRVDIFGWGMLAHAVSAVSVFALGYRPFCYFWAPVFLLYELSSPFLNIHWFCDKVGLTGSTTQAVNGALLTGSFFGCRIVWGMYNSYNTFHDLYTAYAAGHSHAPAWASDKNMRTAVSGDLGIYYDAGRQERAFMGQQYLPPWLPIIYLASNLVLNALNVWWFFKMIQTIRKRFDPPFGTKGVGSDLMHYEPGSREKKLADDKAAAALAKGRASLAGSADREGFEVQRGVYADGRKSVEVTGSSSKGSVRSRRKA